ncbi:MAG TPA: alpha/beta fold hydrolase [Thermoleophilaceae bacterium]
MTVGTAAQVPSPPDVFNELLERFDPHVIDLRERAARIRLAVTDGQSSDVVIRGAHAWLEPPLDGFEPDALLSADRATWEKVARDIRGGMDAFRRGRLSVRSNLHLGVGLLAATSGITEPGRLRFESVKTSVGSISTMQAGSGHPVVALHGLGGTKASFLPTIAALADSYRVIALDLPGFGDSDKPIAAPYNSAWFARSVTALMDELGIERAHLVGNSMGGRVAIELGLTAPDRAQRIVLLSPALAWLRDRRWALFVRALRPELGLLQVAPRPVVERIVRGLIPGAADGWAAAGVDEFLRAYLTPRGRAAFYAAARNIYLDEPHGDDGFWTRLAALAPDSMFVWGRQDGLVPISFMKHVERVLPAARHVELDCGHVPQLERPREVHAAMRDFFESKPR